MPFLVYVVDQWEMSYLAFTKVFKSQLAKLLYRNLFAFHSQCIDNSSSNMHRQEQEELEILYIIFCGTLPFLTNLQM